MDLNHGLFFTPPVEISVGDYSDCADADIVIVTAGAKQKPGQSRLDLVRKNVEICRGIVQQIVGYTREAILLLVTNPVDVLTYVALKTSELSPKRVIGSGTVLDSARFRYLLSRHCGVDPHNIHAYILGEHGDSEVAAWSISHIAGVRLTECSPICNRECSEQDRRGIVDQVRKSAYHIIEAKGATCYGIALALEKIVRAILRDERSVLTVSRLVEGYCGINDVCLSIPSVLGRTGAERPIHAELSREEQEALQASARTLKQVLSEAGF
jgi:L-lactate dehydrogenase